MDKKEVYKILDHYKMQIGMKSTGNIERSIFPDPKLKVILGVSLYRKQLYLKIKLPENIKYKVKSDASYRNLAIILSEDNQYVIFYLVNDAYLDIFSTMTSEIYDLISTQAIKNSEEEKFEKIIEFIDNWRLFFQPIPKLSREIIAGLLCELLVLKEIINIGMPADIAINGWNGPNHTCQDFEYNGVYFEIKYISNGNIKISSKFQLYSEGGNPIILKTFTEDATATAISLNSIIHEIKNLISDNELVADFIKKVEVYGFNEKLHGEREGGYTYNIGATYMYIIDDRFPRLIPTNIPSQIFETKYSILTNQIMNNIIPEDFPTLLKKYDIL